MVGEQGEVKWLLTTNENLHKISFLLGLRYEYKKKYKASTDQVSMMGDLADYMGKYSDMMAKLDAIDSKSLSDADAAYYAEVSARVMKKLAEVA